MDNVNRLPEKSASLNVKADLMSNYMAKLDLVKPFREVARDQYMTVVSRQKLNGIADAQERRARAELYDTVSATILSLSLSELIQKLAMSSLEEKSKVLQSIPIVPVPVAASYLGVNEAELHRLKYECNDMFGARYLGRKCYSMEELQLIARNPEWMSQDTMAESQEESELPKLGVLYPLTFVDINVAEAYTNLDALDLSLYERPSYRSPSRSLFRLSDLEKIRDFQQTYTAD
jgi:hypothetical protein